MTDLKDIFYQNNYRVTNETPKAVEFESSVGSQVVYLLPNKELSIVLNPNVVEGNEELKNKGYKLYHSTALRQFPKRRNKGKQEIHYGCSFTFQSGKELNTFLQNFNNGVDR